MSTVAATKPKESQAFQQLKEQLREMFQLDRGDLDFGIYRVMNQKREDVTKFLDEQLLPQVREVLGDYQPAGMAGAKDELNKTIASLKDAGVDPETSPKVQELKQKLSQSVDVGKLENEIYSDLYNFFKRYYSDGDFMSMRRYKEGVYALPYEGEEVKLHWANHDQYYIKTSENLKNFTFKAANGQRVRFEVVAGGTETNNNKAQEGKERRFILHDDAPTEMMGDELVIRFEYRPDADKRKQDALNQEAIDALSPLAEITSAGLLEPAPTEKKKDRTVLEKYLTEYTAKFSFDYFIHKDLGKFLRRELDFYIKNEIFHLDDIENENAPKVESYLGKVKAMRQVAGKIIQFLAQLEDFQKKLWLKKKFVLETHYCVTLDHIIDSDVADSLLPVIAENADQNAEWVKLFAIDDLDGYAETLSVDFLKANDKLLVDTKFFDVDFKYAVLSVFDDLDAQTDGLLINSENFQALNLLRGTYKKSIQTVYIDPPYNTVHSAIIYKNQYKHSSWLSLINNTLPIIQEFWAPNFSFGMAIDDYEYTNLSMLLKSTYPHLDYSLAVVNHHPQGSGGRLSRTHEYYIMLSEESSPQYLGKPKEDYSEERSFMRSGTAENNYRSGRWNSFYALLLDEESQTIIGTEPPVPLGEEFPLEHTDDGFKRIYPINSRGEERVWRSSYETGTRRVQNGEIAITMRGSIYQLIDHEGKRETLFSNWIGSEFNAGTQGTSVLDDLGLNGEFDYPKSVKTLETGLWAQSFGNTENIILDYFAGSATTGHAVVNLNREDGGSRKYILVEMGDYFNKVTKPRIEKVVFSKEWKSGKPVKMAGIKQLIKYHTLEQYEDSLDNLIIEKSDTQAVLLDSNDALNEQYMLGYMMEMETKGSPSLLNIDSFADPFAYQLRITRDDDTQTVNVDLIETFNYLLGLTIRTIDRDKNGIVTVVGTNSLGENCLIIWRNVNDVDSGALETWFGKRYSSKDFEFDAIYVNGDNNIENLKVDGDLWKVRLIEAEFSRLMFDVQDV